MLHSDGRAPTLETQDRKIPHIKIVPSRCRHFGRSADAAADHPTPTPITNGAGGPAAPLLRFQNKKHSATPVNTDSGIIHFGKLQTELNFQ